MAGTNRNDGTRNDAASTDATTGRPGDAGRSAGWTPGAAGIRERMDVIASCGTKIGVVDHVEGGAIKLTRDSSGDGQHHFLPVGMVDHVDQHVHLRKNSEEARREWKSDAVSCGSCG